MTQLQNWADVRDRHSACERFVAFLEERGVTLDFRGLPAGSSANLRDHLDDFFEIDRTALDDERRAMIDGLAVTPAR